MSALTLTRRPGEIVSIGENVEVEVLEIRGGQVCLRIFAPRDVIIDRLEIRERKLTEQGFDPGRVT